MDEKLKEQLAARKAERERIQEQKRERRQQKWNRKAWRNQSKRRSAERRKARRERAKAKKENKFSEITERKPRIIYPQNPDHEWGTKKDGTPKKKPGCKPGVPHNYPEVDIVKEAHRKRALGLLGERNKRPDAGNHQIPSIQNPRGAGPPRRTLSAEELKNRVQENKGAISTDLVVERALSVDTVAFQHLDGFYSRADGGYSPEEKLAAVSVWLVTNSFAETERQTGVKAQTVSNWRRTAKWWPAVTAEIGKLANDYLENRTTKALDLAMDIVLDRLQHGNIKLKERKVKETDEETGETEVRVVTEEQRVPISLNDASTILDRTYGVRDKIQNNITGETAKDINVKLDELKNRFKRMVTEKTIEGEAKVIDEDSN